MTTDLAASARSGSSFGRRGRASAALALALSLALALVVAAGTSGAGLRVHAQRGARARERTVRIRATADACERGDPASCLVLVAPANAHDARRAGVLLDDTRAGVLLERGCVGGHAPACEWLAARAERAAARARRVVDAGIERDERARWYTLGCDFGSASACLALGHAFARGDAIANDPYLERDDVGPDSGRASGYYEEACALGARAACGAAIDAYVANADPCAALRVRARWCTRAPHDRRCRPDETLVASCRERSSIPLPAPEPDSNDLDAGLADARAPGANAR